MTATILPSRSPSGSPVYAPTSRPVYRGGAVPGGGSFDWTQFFGVGDDGFVFDGSQSRFYTDSAMTTECSASGSDPVGAIEDISGKGNHAVQATSANKPVYFDNGGIKSAHVGSVGANDRTFVPGSGLYTSAAFTVIAIYEWTTDGGNGTNVLCNFNAGWSGGNYFCLRSAGGSGIEFFADADVTPITVASSVGDKRIAVVDRAGTGTNETTITAYQLNGTQTGTASGTEPTTNQGPMRIGADLSGCGNEKIAFLMYINRALSAPERASVMSQLATTFAGWTP